MHYLDCLNGVTDFSDTKEILINKKLIVKEYENLFLVKYDKNLLDITDSDSRKCRGLIMEKNTNKVVCIPPQKSIRNFPLDNFNNIIFEEFVDGTLINVFKYNNVVYISTKSCLDAQCKYYSSKTFNLLFNECIDVSIFNNLDENICLSFVIQHPENIIVQKYEKPDLVLVSGVDLSNYRFIPNKELQSLLESKDMTFKIPKSYNIDDDNGLQKKVASLTQHEQGLILKLNNDNSIRGKIRNDYYNYVKDLKGNTNNKKYLYFELRKNKSLEEYIKYFPEDTEIFESYRTELYDAQNTLFNFYQDCHVRKNSDTNKKKIKFLEIDFEYRPLCNDLHSKYITDNQIITKYKVIQYLNNIPTAKLLFVLNYKNNLKKNLLKEIKENNTKYKLNIKM